MLHDFSIHLDRNFNFLKSSKFIIAISGGIDSVVLAHLCHMLGLNFSLAHCNFNLRGEESDADEEFVTKLAKKLSIESHTESFNTLEYASENGMSIQMAARELRYNWFYNLCDNLNCEYILTAHHLDDSLETFLINFSRGTGLEGLKGIPNINEKVVRPLLPFSRNDIELFAKDYTIDWREDRSNSSTKYLRNKIRHDIVPQIKQVQFNLLQNFKTTLKNLNHSSDIVNYAIDEFLKSAIISEVDDCVKYNVDSFKKLNNPKAFLFEVFKSYGFTQWDDILDLLNTQSGKYVLSNTHRLLKDRSKLILSKINVDNEYNDFTYDINEFIDNKKVIKTPFNTVLIELKTDREDSLKKVLYLDYEKLSFPLKLRKWKTGDFFIPSGMKGKKKLSKFFKDEKYSLLDKESALILENNDLNISAILGKRVDERFKANEKTKQFLKLEILE